MVQGEIWCDCEPEWYVFPFGKPQPTDPTRPVTTLKTAWNKSAKERRGDGRWHDNRHTLITDLAESGAGDQTIMDIAGHVSKQMLKHYSHIRMEAKRDGAGVDRGKNGREKAQRRVTNRMSAALPTVAQHFEGESLQKSLQSGVFEGHRGVVKAVVSL